MNDSIILLEYQNEWPLKAEKEISRITSALSDGIIKKIAHVGSTAVVGCKAKPIIDIAICVSKIDDGHSAINTLESLEYVFWPDNPDKTHLFFVKGMPPYGEFRTHHIHFFEESRYQEHIRFRDILCKNKEILQEYQRLKVRLAQKHKNNREAYTNSKSDFIKRVLNSHLR